MRDAWAAAARHTNLIWLGVRGRGDQNKHRTIESSWLTHRHNNYQDEWRRFDPECSRARDTTNITTTFSNQIVRFVGFARVWVVTYKWVEVAIKKQSKQQTTTSQHQTWDLLGFANIFKLQRISCASKSELIMSCAILVNTKLTIDINSCTKLTRYIIIW
jgi:hypothetical protein